MSWRKVAFVKGWNGQNYEPGGSESSEPSVFILSIWFSVAAFALVFAVVALFYSGSGDSSPSDVSAFSSSPDPVTTGSLRGGNPLAQAFGGDDLAGGRSDIAGTLRPSDASTAADVARLKVENVALRQSVDTLRGQIDRLTERLEEMETHIAEVTGSISTDGSAPKEPTFFDTPDVPAKATGATASALATAANPQSTRFGIELGSYTDLASVKLAWKKLTDEHATLFAGLDALATVRDRMGRTELVLVAGPFKSAADASEHCGKVEAAGLICQPAFYLGQQLSVR